MCVDDYGNMLTNELMYVGDGDDWQRICVEELACSNSDVSYNGNGAARVDSVHIDEPKPSLLNVGNLQTIQSLTVWILEVMGILLSLLIGFYIKKLINNANDKEDWQQQKEKLINDEEIIPIKDDME